MNLIDTFTPPSLDQLATMFASGQLSTESRKLTAEERAQAREDRKSRAKRNYIAEIGEEAVQGWLERRFKRDWHKSPVVPRWDGMGYASTDVDLLGCLGRDSRKARCEVKTTYTNRIPFSSFNKNERRYLAQAVKGNEIAFVCLVWLDKEMHVKFMHAIPWTDLLALEQSMAGKYGGKSLKKADWKALEKYKIAKENGRYVLPNSHWLCQYLLGDDDANH